MSEVLEASSALLISRLTVAPEIRDVPAVAISPPAAVSVTSPVVVRLATVIPPGVNCDVTDGSTVSVMLPDPVLIVVSGAIVILPVPLSLLDVAPESFAVMEIAPLLPLVEISAFTKTDRPACMVSPAPVLPVMAIASLTVISVVACKTTVAAELLMLVGVIVVFAPGLLAKRLLLPAE